MREKYESLSLTVLKELAKARGMRGISAMKKGDLIAAMLEQDEKDAQQVHTDRAETTDSKDSGRSTEHRRERQEVRRDNTENGGYARRDNAENGGYARRDNAENGGYARRENAENGGYARRDNTENGGYVRRENAENGGYARRDNTENGGYVRRENTENGGYARRENAENGGYVRKDNIENAGYARRNNTENTGYTRRDTVENTGYVGRNGAENSADNSDQRTDRPPTELSQLDSGIVAEGILEVMPDGFGFIRSDNYMPGDNDVYVSPSQIRRFNLKTGDIISGNMRIRAQQEKFGALLYLKTINGKTPAEAMRRYNFEDMTPIFPNQRLRMERGTHATAMRIVDLFSPIGKGQRGMIVSPPKAGKTTLLKDVARSILENDPKMKLLILLIDERPEEVTDIKEAIRGENVEVIYSTFDELPEHHKRVSEMVIERAKRLVEQREDVTILLDSITRLARAYNMTVPPSGRTLSGGLDPAALHMPKRFFGAARNMREGGSLTILATVLVDTGSKMDDVVYEEFKGTGNMELVLDRKLSEKRVFPAIDFPKSGTRRDDLLLDREEQEAVYIMRRALNGMKADEAVENILNMFVHTRDNRELVQKVRRQKFI